MTKSLRFALAFFLFFMMPAFCHASQSGAVKKGNQQYKKGDYAAALKSYKKALDREPNSDIINFNVGTAFYQQGDYVQALEHLEKTLLTEDARLRQQAVYNLGNAFYQQGKAKEKQDMAGAVASLEKSLASFQKAIDLDQADKDAQHNYEFVKKELAKLEKQQQEQQNKNCPLPKKEDSSKDNQGKQQSQNQQQNQPQQQNQQQEQQPQEQKDSQEQSSQGDQDQEKKEDSQDRQSPQSSSEDKAENNAEKKSQSSSEGKASMTKEQAEAALGNYQQNEEPKGLLYLLKKPAGDNTVDKDW